MKIQPPLADIPEDDPFKHAIFERKLFGESLTALIQNVEDRVVVSINAPWGEGKTTFARMWLASLKARKFDAIYFDAYATDYLEDPFVSFTGEILEFAKSRVEWGKTVGPSKEFKKTAVEVGKQLGGLVAKIAVRAATMGIVNESHMGELKEIGQDAAKDLAEIGGGVVEKKIEEYATDKEAQKKFRSSLAKLAAAVRSEQGFPLTIVVDELDRCRPSYALELLERIKHLFDVDGVAFVLLVNRDQIENYIRAVYGDQVDAKSYLLKFISIAVDLPAEQPLFHHSNAVENFRRSLWNHYAFEKQVTDSGFLARALDTVISHLGLSLRETERMFLVLATYYASLPKGNLTNEFLVAVLAALKVKRPDIYARLRAGKIEASEFFTATAFDRLPEKSSPGISSSWAADMLNFCLMSEEAMAALEAASQDQSNSRRGPLAMGNWLFRYNISRRQVIPVLCRELDRFVAVG